MKQGKWQTELELAEPPPKLKGSKAAKTVPIDSAFPVAEANELAHTESFNKHLFRPNTYLHKWWARRSGTTFRYILKQLIQDEVYRDYYAPDGLDGKIILDPMMGGGTTVHEAVRMGARVIGFDLDPIPVLQAKASLTEIPLAEKQVVFTTFFAELAKRLRPYFGTSCPTCDGEAEIRFTLWALQKQCACGTYRFVDSLRLREEADGTVIMLCPATGESFAAPSEEQARNSMAGDPVIFEKTVRTCPRCSQPFTELLHLPFRERYVPLIIVGSCREHGQFFHKASDDDFKKVKKAATACKKCVLPSETETAVEAGPKSKDLLRRNVSSYIEVFSSRQLIYISTCKELLEKVPPVHQAWLGMLISTSLEFNSLLCGYKGSDKRRPGAIRHVFSHHAYSYPTTALESNPVFSGASSGTISLLFRDRIEAASEFAQRPVERRRDGKGWTKVPIYGETDQALPVSSFEELSSAKRKVFWVQQQSSISLPVPAGKVDHVVTDPPYFDSVQYSDLAMFFRVWLKWLIPSHADWSYDRLASAVAETDKGGQKYEEVLTGIWSECHRVLNKRSGRLIFTFHHWRAEAWIRLTNSLKRSNFRLVTTYTIHSENPISVHIRQLNALKHDSILVLQPVTGKATANAVWELPTIPTNDSAAFCTGCAQMLGYALQSNLSDEEVAAIWNDALKG